MTNGHPNRLDELLRADEENVQVAREDLGGFHHGMMDTFLAAHVLFETFVGCAGASFSELDAENDRQLGGIACDLGLSDDELRARLRSDPASPELERARELWNALHDRESKRLVLLLLLRYFRWGLSDLLRLRVTAMFGYGRLQAEACALLRLFAEEPQRMGEWRMAGPSEHDGRRFHRETRQRITAIMERYHLAHAYNHGSSVAQHVRIGATVRSVSFDERGTQLRDQEVDPDHPDEYYRAALWFLSTQGKIFANLSDAVPEVRCEGWTAQWQEFIRQLAPLWATLVERFPAEG